MSTKQASNTFFKIEEFYTAADLGDKQKSLQFIKSIFINSKKMNLYYDIETKGYWVFGPFTPFKDYYLYLGGNPQRLLAAKFVDLIATNSNSSSPDIYGVIESWIIDLSPIGTVKMWKGSGDDWLEVYSKRMIWQGLLGFGGLIIAAKEHYGLSGVVKLVIGFIAVMAYVLAIYGKNKND